MVCADNKPASCALDDLRFHVTVWYEDLDLDALARQLGDDAVERIAVHIALFQLNAACHDHPKPSTYWNPDTVLQCVKGRSKRLGACADTGHWPRSGLVAVECLRKLEGRIVSLHFKDIAPADKTGVDQPWGTGANDARAMLAELHRQGFRGVACHVTRALSVPHEPHGLGPFLLGQEFGSDRGHGRTREP